MKMQLLTLGILLMSYLVVPEAWASDVYKCKDKNGKLNYTDSPCPQAAKMIPYSKTTQENHEFRMKKAAQEKRFRSETYRQTTVLMPSY